MGFNEVKREKRIGEHIRIITEQKFLEYSHTFESNTMLSYTSLESISKMFIKDMDDPSMRHHFVDEIIPLPEMTHHCKYIDGDTCCFVYTYRRFHKLYGHDPKKTKLVKHNCMWSGRCTTHPPKPGKAKQIQRRTPPRRYYNKDTIRAGQSLLINSRLNKNTNHSQRVPPIMTANEFLKDREPREFNVRPDTPLSLDDDDTHDFKHTTDLSACTMGSNNIQLISGSSQAEAVNLIKEHLEDSSLHYKDNSRMLPILSTSKEDSYYLFSDIKALSDYQQFIDATVESVESDAESSTNATAISYDSSYANSSQTTHSDHSYTRSKNRVDVDGLGVQTPSDSEEEIDVVSVGEKALPTNPTANDRKVLQTTVAHKISNRIVKTASGVRTIPPRRRDSNESEISTFTTVSSSSFKYPETPTSSTVMRKKQNANEQAGNKRSRGKKQQQKQQPKQKQQQRPAVRRGTTDTDEMGTIERRNLHNNMERQRRIGLKKQFDYLKLQIPNLKDKERAPKVSILREAMLLCRRLTEDHRQQEALMVEQARLHKRVKALRKLLAQQRIVVFQ
ncbi:Myc protein [Pseudolycoriella hygida]|uniref:Myc protein n=1 Tax=Pseudolycoriella hygida TaxID=35572 RepID=A0A9Q0MX70_9DIPT|nr:Myc protein [Pseudolycoriella hygida]